MPRVDLATAVATLRAGSLCAIPTETVYGLGADALNPEAVREVFRQKGRPAGHPLILHARDPRPYAVFDARAEALSRFWPGPLTLILPRRPNVPLEVTGGRETVAVRVPAHPLTLELLDQLGRPVAAPSANRFGEVSPTTADHVLAAWPDLPVLDGGPCTVGLESTIVDLSGPVASVLRPGWIAADELGIELGDPGDTAAPGTLAAHYQPTARLIATTDPDRELRNARSQGLHRVGVLHAGDPVLYARSLYGWMRELDAQGVELIIAELVPERGIGIAINDRLRRASR